MSTIIGIDPGTTTTGFAVLRQKQGKEIEILNYGIIESEPKIDLGLKLLEIGDDIKSLIEKYNPDFAAIEKLYFTNNIKTGIDVSHARGVMMYNLMKSGVKIMEFTPLEVKSAITGYGKAGKKQVQNAIKILLKMDHIPKPDDAADALGIAYMGLLNIKTFSLIKNLK